MPDTTDPSVFQVRTDDGIKQFRVGPGEDPGMKAAMLKHQFAIQPSAADASHASLFDKNQLAAAQQKSAQQDSDLSLANQQPHDYNWQAEDPSTYGQKKAVTLNPMGSGVGVPQPFYQDFPGKTGPTIQDYFRKYVGAPVTSSLSTIGAALGGAVGAPSVIADAAAAGAGAGLGNKMKEDLRSISPRTFGQPSTTPDMDTAMEAIGGAAMGAAGKVLPKAVDIGQKMARPAEDLATPYADLFNNKVLPMRSNVQDLATTGSALAKNAASKANFATQDAHEKFMDEVNNAMSNYRWQENTIGPNGKVQKITQHNIPAPILATHTQVAANDILNDLNAAQTRSAGANAPLNKLIDNIEPLTTNSAQAANKVIDKTTGKAATAPVLSYKEMQQLQSVLNDSGVAKYVDPTKLQSLNAAMQHDTFQSMGKWSPTAQQSHLNLGVAKTNESALLNNNVTKNLIGATGDPNSAYNSVVNNVLSDPKFVNQAIATAGRPYTAQLGTTQIINTGLDGNTFNAQKALAELQDPKKLEIYGAAIPSQQRTNFEQVLKQMSDLQSRMKTPSQTPPIFDIGKDGNMALNVLHYSHVIPGSQMLMVAKAINNNPGIYRKLMQAMKTPSDSPTAMAIGKQLGAFFGTAGVGAINSTGPRAQEADNQ